MGQGKGILRRAASVSSAGVAGAVSGAAGPGGSSREPEHVAIPVVNVLQGMCGAILASDAGFSLFGAGPAAAAVRSLAVVGLVLGIGAGAVLLYRGQMRLRAADAAPRVARAAFMDLLDRRFRGWRLTPAERDVALFAVKGLTTSEIATLRETSEGTVKAQMNAIYRKAGVNSRSQLLSLFIEDLMDDPATIREDTPKSPLG